MENDASSSSVVACVYVAAVTCLPRRCPATIKGYTFKHTDSWEGFMKYAVEMGSGTTIYIPSFIKIGPGMQMLIRRDTQPHRQHGELISLVLFF
jgi:hypothetical protein